MESQSTYSTAETDVAVNRIESIMPALMQLFRDGEIGGTDEGWQSMIEILDQHLTKVKHLTSFRIWVQIFKHTRNLKGGNQ